MILRRFSQSLKDQNWTAICIEFVLLVLGVFLGIQVANWNDDRATRAKAAVFTERLRDDLRKEAWGYEYILQYSRETNANQRRALDAMSGAITLSDEQFLVSTYRATQYKQLNRNRATYDELWSTGSMGLVADQPLLMAAMDVFASPWLDQIAEQTKNSEYRRLFRETVSADLQEALLTRCGDRLGVMRDLNDATIKNTLDYPCTLDMPAQKIRAAVDALKADPRFVPALRTRFADNQTALFELQSSNEATAKMFQTLRDAAP